MSCDNVRYEGRFRDPAGNYDELRDTLIKDFIELGLEPDEGFWSDDVEGWKTLFEIKNGYMELEIYNCFGNYGDATDYFKKKLPKKLPDIQFEFNIIVDDADYRACDKITYNGQFVEHMEYGASFYDMEETVDAVCPNCGSELEFSSDCLVCSECDTELDQEDLDELGLDIDLEGLEYEITDEIIEELDEQIKFKLIK